MLQPANEILERAEVKRTESFLLPAPLIYVEKTLAILVRSRALRANSEPLGVSNFIARSLLHSCEERLFGARKDKAERTVYTIFNRILRRHRYENAAAPQTPSLQRIDTDGKARAITRDRTFVNVKRSKEGERATRCEVLVAERIEGNTSTVLEHEVERLFAAQAARRAEGRILKRCRRRRDIKKGANRLLRALRKAREVPPNERFAHLRPLLAGLFSVGLSLAPAVAAEAKPTQPQLTQQDLNDIAIALSIVGSHCNADQIAACQAGADSKALFAKLEAIFASQQDMDKAKK